MGLTPSETPLGCITKAQRSRTPRHSLQGSEAPAGTWLTRLRDPRKDMAHKAQRPPRRGISRVERSQLRHVRWVLNREHHSFGSETPAGACPGFRGPAGHVPYLAGPRRAPERLRTFRPEASDFPSRVSPTLLVRLLGPLYGSFRSFRTLR